MSVEPAFEWADIEKALQRLAGIVDSTVDKTGDPNVRTLLQNLAIEIRDNTQQLGPALVQCNSMLEAHRESARKSAEQLREKCGEIVQKANAQSAVSQPVVTPPTEPDADPGPRLCRELLDRYGFDLVPPSNPTSIGWDTWVEEPSTAANPHAASVDQAREEWKKLLEHSRVEESRPAPSGQAGPPKEGWSTWLDQTSNNS